IDFRVNSIESSLFLIVILFTDAKGIPTSRGFTLNLMISPLLTRIISLTQVVDISSIPSFEFTSIKFLLSFFVTLANLCNNEESYIPMIWPLKLSHGLHNGAAILKIVFIPISFLNFETFFNTG